MEYFTADTYKNWTRVGEPFDKNGKLYTKVKEVCDRCSGKGIAISHIMNGQPIPYTPDGGVCYQCGGVGFRTKEVRLYTESEYKKMVATNEAARIKREAAREAKMKAEYDEKRKEWITKEGFDLETLTTYVVTGNSYAIKEELKAAGFIYSPVLKWHRATPGDYPCIEVKLNDIADFSAWGTGNYHSDAQKIIQDRLDALNPKSNSEWFGEEKEKFSDLKVVVKDIHSYTNRFGYGRIFTFSTGDNILKWFTSTNQNINVDDVILISGIIKEHSEYKGEKQTLIKNCKIKTIT